MILIVFAVMLGFIGGCHRAQGFTTTYNQAMCPMAIGRVANDLARQLNVPNGQCVDVYNKPIPEECCTRPWQTRAEQDECEKDPIGWTSEGDFCYDGRRGAAFQVAGSCCERIRAAIHGTMNKKNQP
jgi:hypothetical protein